MNTEPFRSSLILIGKPALHHIVLTGSNTQDVICATPMVDINKRQRIHTDDVQYKYTTSYETNP